jgi:hypothetical protein
VYLNPKLIRRRSVWRVDRQLQISNSVAKQQTGQRQIVGN